VVACGLAGSTSATVTCGNCTNNAVNVNYYVGQGAYTPGSCPLSACRICDNGNYLIGCGSVNSRGCTACTNIV
jgi:hypothetical protein